MASTSKQSTDLRRLCRNRKLVNKYQKIARRTADKTPSILSPVPERRRHDTIWICWFQGMDTAPELVKRCYHSISKLNGKKVIVIDSDNFSDYVQLPEFIVEKWKHGRLSHAHFSDLLRLELLYQHGGIWLDATVYCSSDTLPDFIEESSLFFYQVLPPNLDGHAVVCSSWAISAAPCHPALALTREVLFAYWKQNRKLEDYFLFHIVVSGVLWEYPDLWRQVPKVCNASPHLLQFELFDEFDEVRYQQIRKLSDLHKLTYKYDKDRITDSSVLSRFLAGDYG